MEILRVRESYSYIGPLADFLINQQQRIKNLLIDYEIQSKVENLPDGREIKSLLFTKQNVTVRFLPDRIDYTYNLPNPSISLEESYESAKQFFNLFSEIFYDVKAQRIAIVSQAFIKNENNQAIQDLTSKMNLVREFGLCNELKFKINNPKSLFEPVNSVLNIDMGEAKNNKTQEVLKVLLLSVDVNTLAENKELRFDPVDFDLDFSELLSEVKSQQDKLTDFIK